jgi:DNA-binding IclR family transcriptional regulator
VVDVVELLAAAPDAAFSLSDIARRTGQNVATCLAVTATLAERGWLARDPQTKAFSTGPVLRALNSPKPTGYAAALAARSELLLLADELGMQATSAVVEGPSLVLIEVVGGDDGERLIGGRVPLVPPFGSVFVAWTSEPAQQDWLERARDLDTAHLQAIRDDLALTVERGYSVEWLTEPAIRLRRLIAELPELPGADALRCGLSDVLADLTRSGYLGRTPDANAHLPVSVITAPIADRDGVVVADVAVQPLRPMTADEIADVGERVIRAAARARETWISGSRP